MKLSLKRRPVSEPPKSASVDRSTLRASLLAASALGFSLSLDAESEGQLRVQEDEASRCSSTETLDEYVPPSQEDIEKALKRRENAVKEMLLTEKSYIEQLEQVMQYYEAMKNHESMPEDLKDGKYRMVFGNAQAIYEWHRDFFYKELSDACEEPRSLGQLFKKNKRKFDKYYKYCENKPMSDFIVKEHDSYFLELWQTFNMKWEISHLLIVPIQRITKYPLLIREIMKHTKKAGLLEELPEMQVALEIAKEVNSCTNDMMKAGMIQGFPGSITNQGRILKHGPLLCMEGSSVQNFKGKSHLVFLFEQTIIFASSSKKSQTSEVFPYKKHLKVNQMTLIKETEDNDHRKFIVKSINAKQLDLAYVCQAESKGEKDKWVGKIQELLNLQKYYSDIFSNPIQHLPST